MKKAPVLVLVGSALALALSFASAQPDVSRPPNVAASDWIPLAQDAGFVVTGGNSQTATLGLAPAVSGHLMARRNGKWVRLDVEGGGRFVEAR
jgi:hypothetical protein